MTELCQRYVYMAMMASIVILVVLVVRPFFRRFSNRIACLLWAVVLLRLLCPVKIGGLSIFRLELVQKAETITNASTEGAMDFEAEDEFRSENAGNTQHTDVRSEVYAQQNSVLSATDNNEAIAVLNDLKPIEEMPFEASDRKTQIALTTDRGNDYLSNYEVSENTKKGVMKEKAGVAARQFSNTLLGRGVISACVIVWLLGLIGFLIYGTIRYVSLIRRLDEAIPLKKRGKLWIKMSDISEVPMSFGIVHPCIYVPVSFGEGVKDRVVSEQQEMIITHEAMHLRHRDPLWKLLAYIACAIHWWNPLVWLAIRCMNQDLEMTCDEAVLKEIGLCKRKEYAYTLLEFAMNRSGISLVAAFGESHAEKRVKNVMKYKNSPIWLSVILTAGVLSLGGCLVVVNTNSGTDIEPSAYEEQKKDVADNEVTGKQSIMEAVDEQSANDEQHAMGPDHEVVYDDIKSVESLSLLSGEEDVCYVIDDAGRIYGKLHENDLIEKAREKGFNVWAILCVANGVVYMSGDELCAIDLKTYDVLKLLGEEAGNIEAVDYYNGKLCINTIKQRQQIKEYIFVKDNDSFSYQQEENNLDAFYQAAKDYEIVYFPRFTQSYRDEYSYSRAFDKCGYVIAVRYSLLKRPDNAFVRITKEGVIAPLNVDTDISILDYNRRYMIYSDKNELQTLFLYDIESGASTPIYQHERREFPFLGLMNDKLYYCKDRNADFRLDDYVIYQYDLQQKEEKVFYQQSDIQGNGIEDWRIIGNKFYYLGLVQEKKVWLKGELEDFDGTFENTGCVKEVIPTYLYGSIDAATAQSVCSECQKIVEYVYAEAFVLDQSFSAHANKINAYLRDKRDAYIKNVKPEVDPDGWGCEQQELTEKIIDIRKAQILNGKYLIVGVGYVCYQERGNIPDSSYYELMFDLANGDAVTVADIYTGTEEEFKQLVASKTCEEFETELPAEKKNNADMVQAKEKVYEEAYRLTGFETSVYYFYQDYLLINFDNDKVYDLFTDAELAVEMDAGGVYVKIPYEELLGRSEL